ncbi:AAA family ATPase [Bacteroides sp.]|uniref:AAA family ATPase n=1 Tax=Bacteroides sp. TaxID=29523 RepID=UPI0025C35CC3|nr:AAA family ATPase [Bacteroides sp.]
MSEQDKKKYTIISPQSENDTNYLIDGDFNREVVLHFVKNRIRILNSPLILCVQGKAGEGKSSHILQICKRLKIWVFLIHGSALCGNHEGEPADIINDLYITASEYSKQYNNVVILVDDIDTSVASTIDNREYTVNSQLINGVFMNIANNPYSIGNMQTKRIPIIFTGNNLMNLYAPLKRTGRIRLYSWSPNNEQKLRIIENLYKDIIHDNEKKEFNKLIQPYINQPISFFVDLKSNLFDDVIVNEILKQKKVDLPNLEYIVCTALTQYGWLSKIETTIQALAKNTIQDFNE